MKESSVAATGPFDRTMKSLCRFGNERQAEPDAFRLGCHQRLKHSLGNVRRGTGAAIFNFEVKVPIVPA